MFAITNDMISLGEYAPVRQSECRRHYRGRNHLAASRARWSGDPTIPVDPPYWDDMVGGSVRIGAAAARKTIKPALLVWGLMTGIALLYYLVPASQGAFAALVRLQDRMGVWFPSVGMGLSVGILVEVVRVGMGSDKRWRRANTLNAAFNFIIWSVMGVTQHYRYAWQVEVFGAGNSFTELATKVAFDQFIWTVFFANPYQAILYLWKNCGFSWRSVARMARPLRTFWGTQMLPMLISNWAFWIPMAFLVYFFPPELQIPMAILAVTIWVILLSFLTTASHRDES